MEVGRIALALGFFGFAAGSFFFFTEAPPGLTVTNVELQPMGSAMALIATVDNQGVPDRLTGVGTDASSGAALVGASGDVVIPAGSAPSLSMDGVHGMLTGFHNQASEGQLVPVTLWFENGGRRTTRARVIGGMAMSHGILHEVPKDGPQPSVSLVIAEEGDEWVLKIETSDFTFSQDAVDGPHQPGVGHAHLYLNGLKLQRLYSAEAKIGALLPGPYEVVVTLNTNDHRAYSVGGKPVAAVEKLTVD